MFCYKLPVEITMVKGIVGIYKYDQRKWLYPYPIINFVIPPCFDTSIQTEHNSDPDAFKGIKDVVSAGFDQCTHHNGNIDGKDNDYLQSFETPRKNNCSYSYYLNTISNTNTTQTSKLSPP